MTHVFAKVVHASVGGTASRQNTCSYVLYALVLHGSMARIFGCMDMTTSRVRVQQEFNAQCVNTMNRGGILVVHGHDCLLTRLA